MCIGAASWSLFKIKKTYQFWTVSVTNEVKKRLQGSETEQVYIVKSTDVEILHRYEI